MTPLRIVLLLVATLLTACHPDARHTAPPDTLTVVTLNLWHDKADWPRREAIIVRALRTLQPDVIALQEVLQDAHLPNQAKSLAQALGYRHIFVSADAPDAVRRYGNAILTRHRILADDAVLLAPLDDYRSAAHVRVTIGGRTVDVYATHLHHTANGGAIRARQIGDLVDFVRRTRAGDAMLVLGDFNTAADSPELDALRALGLRDAYATLHPRTAADDPAHSTLNPARHPPQRIDHVFVDRLVPLQAGRLFDVPAADGAWASDHFGVYATLRFPPGDR
ncbi:endonuclease/exonuclease/phosphatase family protein [Chiayiivirga flava]|uniref:Endonuclease/exonuclease/phosphatase family metal-dependent hydrolase n=1 Tax=Chiayiivirga flava TaxID=659595 RepID=A0A7W8D6V3_9GAMM|nr:endonuclease/exonuclease/phosphatase family protein [Chiayiivirga flava]MBB5207796.1 endonuclease/exonuclease/phosphatase family metal-dependent hydrolase [Chiayiivirga flava]